ncbi:MAG TPA: M48 family metallopeptidase [Opitutaceae bacterium]|jgi:Zn-dependent protease with chaperone function|nr:M48 family metallopeptidase [Opitutaceae bacterium]
MDFFAAEGRAKKRSSRLMLLFGLAVAGTVVAGYFMTVFGLRASAGYQAARHGYSRSYDSDQEPADFSLWQPKVFAGVTAATLAVIGLASLYKWTEFRSGGAAVAESVGGRRVDPHTTDPKEHQLLNVVEEMAIASGVPVPAVYILDEEPAINAFAAGLTPDDAVVTVTRGTLEKLKRDELQGVVAHEFSHILNGDMRINIRVSAIIFGILVLGLAGRGVLWSMRFGRVSSDRNEKGNGGAMLVLGIGLALMVIGYVGYFFGRLIQASLSRQREYLADASAVQFTRNPDGIATALKKIGGYAIGSNLETHRAAEISHFFFAQAFRSNFGGLWATHPTLGQRIFAIDPSFDGKFIDPPQMVDVAKEPWSKVAHMPPPLPSPSPAAAAAFGTAMIAAAGTLTPESAAGAQALIADIPPAIRAACRSPHDAPILVYGLLLDDDPDLRKRQMASIAASNGGDALTTLTQLEPALRALKPEHRLPVLQLALPAIKAIPQASLGAFAGTLDDLVQADGKVTTFEFALQRLVLRALSISRAPSAPVEQIFSFQAVAREISVVLSALAHASSADAAAAAGAFAEGAAQLKLVQASLTYVSEAESGLAVLDAALDKLAGASGPIKQRLLVAGAHVIGADGVLLTEEIELLRAVAASLDVPVPPLVTQ